MAFTATSTSVDKERPPIGTVRAITVGVYDIGIQDGFEGARVHKALFLWEIDARLEKGEHKGKRHLISNRYKVSMHEKSAMSKMLEGWRGQQFTEEERKAHDLEQYIGKPCLLVLVASKDGQYVNVGSVLPMMAGQEPLQRETPAGYIPEWIVKLIEEGKKAPPTSANWTPEAEGADPATEPLEARRQELRERYGKLKKSFGPERIQMMDAKVRDHANNLPSLEFLIKGWEAEAGALNKASEIF